MDRTQRIDTLPPPTPEELQAFFQECQNFIDELHRYKNSYLQSLNNLKQCVTDDELYEAAKTLRRELRSFRETSYFPNVSKISQFTNILSITPWEDEAKFSHNLISTPLMFLSSELNKLLHKHKLDSKLLLYSNNLPFVLDQAIAHIKAICDILRDTINPAEEAQIPEINDRFDFPSFTILDAIMVVLRARLLRPFHLDIPGISDGLEIKGIKVRLIDGSSHEQQERASFAELIELFYPVISNAHRIMHDFFVINNQQPEINPKIEITLREISYDGQSYSAIEIFNTGPLVDLTKLQEKLLELDIDLVKKVDPTLANILSAINKGSRQASFAANFEQLLLTGITLSEKGSGLGLNSLKNHLSMRNGAILLNNIYGQNQEDRGFCVTILLPKNTQKDPSGENIKKLRQTLEKLKDLLIKGELFLDDIAEPVPLLRPRTNKSSRYHATHSIEMERRCSA